MEYLIYGIVGSVGFILGAFVGVVGLAVILRMARPQRSSKMIDSLVESHRARVRTKLNRIAEGFNNEDHFVVDDIPYKINMEDDNIIALPM